MHELGIFTEDDGLFSVNNGYISAIDQTKANSPMKRHEFACAVAKSFQLNGTVRSKNIYSEVSGLGHDFIMGGSYSKDFLDAYSMFIKDFADNASKNADIEKLIQLVTIENNNIWSFNLSGKTNNSLLKIYVANSCIAFEILRSLIFLKNVGQVVR
mgnify:CR=1 FL=1